MVSLRWFRETRGRGRRGRSRVQRRAGALDTLNQIREVYEIRGSCRLWELMGCRRHPPHVRVPLILADLALASGVTPARPPYISSRFSLVPFFFLLAHPTLTLSTGSRIFMVVARLPPPLNTCVYIFHMSSFRKLGDFFSVWICECNI